MYQWETEAQRGNGVSWGLLGTMWWGLHLDPGLSITNSYYLSQTHFVILSCLPVRDYSVVHEDNVQGWGHKGWANQGLGCCLPRGSWASGRCGGLEVEHPVCRGQWLLSPPC